MRLAPLVVGCLAAFALAYYLYGRLLARLLALDPARVTPAHERRDGVDYVPTPRFYLLSQHFSAISAAGPIAGPILACLAFGWQPSLAWIVLGCVFIGALHDFAALVGSVKHGASSVAGIMRAHASPRAYVLFGFYIWLALIYVVIAFTDITARAFVETLDVSVPGPSGASEPLVVSGAAIAASSMLYLAVSVAMGVCVKLFKPPLWLTTLIFVPLVGLAIAAGPALPIDLRSDGPVPSSTWAYAILAYCGIASLLPVWLLLQPRGYLGGFFLYATLFGGLLGIVIANPAIEFDGYRGFFGATGQPLVPFLFITIACGACSGFHGLVCSGTTSKQLDRETDARLVGYGGMLLEGVVAVIALSCVMILAQGHPVLRMNPDKVFGYGVGSFLAALGLPLGLTVSFGMLAFTTFVYDTLDVCTRLARYLFQELTGWRGRVSGIVATLFSLLIPFLVVGQTATNAAGKSVPAYQVIWPLFGASNQLLAGLTLLGLTLWLERTGKPRLIVWLVAVPMLFMMGMTLSALCLQIKDPGRTPVLLGVAAVLLLLAVWVSIEAFAALLRRPSAAA